MDLFPVGVLDLGRTVGVRPEDIQICRQRAESSMGISATVDLVEPLGNETLLHCVTTARGIKAMVRLRGDGKVDGTRVEHSERIALLPDMTKAVFFDREGRRCS
jgi:ABC-type sugar transport system ATPase subunit